MPHIYVVGQLYDPRRTEWPERAEYNYRSGEHELRIFFPHLTRPEIDAVARASVRLALYTEGHDLLVLLWRFGDQPWADAPYSWWRVDENERLPLPEDPPAGLSVPLSIILVESTNGVLRALRVVSPTHDFARALCQAIQRQAATPLDTARYEAHVASLYRRYPTSEVLAAHAQHRCQIGEGTP